jgi:signal transduction histidine kinase/ActR/RegA family two-component response regulator
MDDYATVRLVAQLAEPLSRYEAAQRVAAHIGATALLMFVDDAVAGAYLPAPGFPQTLTGSGWRELLTAGRQHSPHHGAVRLSPADPPVAAMSMTCDGLMLVTLGSGVDPARAAVVFAMAPLLAVCLRSEHESEVARGEVKAARDHALQVESLARALDATRAELERTVLSLERQARATFEAKGRAEQAARAKDEFLAMLGHELRNPLTPIVTALHLLRLKHQSSRELDIIDRQVAALSRLVEDLLDVSRIASGKIELRRERVEFAEVAARAIEMSSPLLEKKRQHLSVEIAATGLTVYADPSRLAQVFGNLLTNAAKYSDPDQEISILATRDGGDLVVRVLDNGIGIAPAMTDRVFDVFMQQRQSVDRAQGGLGLGLAIVRSLVELHGGTVAANSDGENRGSEFVVRLPLVSAAEIRPALAGPARDGSPQPVSGVRVLVVDDNDDATVMLSEALSACGHIVRTAADGPSALQIARDFRPDIAILDIGLPVMDGYELAGRLRDPDGERTMHLIALTGYGQTQDKERSLQAGFAAHLVKPVSIERLQQLVANVVSRTQAPIA